VFKPKQIVPKAENT